MRNVGIHVFYRGNIKVEEKIRKKKEKKMIKNIKRFKKKKESL